MSTNQNSNSSSYGLNQPLLKVFQEPIISNRAPTANDKQPLGSVWVDKPNAAIYMEADLQGGQATWLSVSGGGGTFSSLTIDPGNLTLTSGSIFASSGNLIINDILADTITAGTEIEVTNGAIVIGNTDNNAAGPFLSLFKSRGGGTIISGDEIGSIGFHAESPAGELNTTVIRSVSSGTIGVTRIASNLEFWTHPDAAGVVIRRLVISSAGNVTINAPDSGLGLDVSGGLTISTGNLNVIGTGQIQGNLIEGSSIYVDGDEGAQSPAIGFTGVTNTTQGAANLVIKSTNANAGNNAGFIKIYVGATTAFIPYFTNIAP